MAFDASQWMTPTGSSAYTINNSVRFDEARTSSLALTPGTAGNRQKFTFSTWVKFNQASNDNCLLHARADANDRLLFGQSSDYLFCNFLVGGTEKFIRTNAIYRDYNNWYHICYQHIYNIFEYYSSFDLFSSSSSIFKTSSHS